MIPPKRRAVEGVFATPFYLGHVEYDYEIPKEGFVDGHNRQDIIAPNVINLDLPELEELILECARFTLDKVGFEEQPMKINQLWLNRYDETRPALPVHFHQNCSWCGTFFPEQANHTTYYLNNNAGYNNIHQPKIKFSTDFNRDYFELQQPPKGAIVIHPPWIGHSVAWNGGPPSHSISFDIAYTGPIGDKSYGSYNDGK